MPESGWIVLVGMRAEITFYKELLDKLGIRADFIQMGVFKSLRRAVHALEDEPRSQAQYKLVLDDFFDNALVGGISRSRSRVNKELTPERVAKIIDEGPFSARQAKELGLIDRVAYSEDLENIIKKDLGKGDPSKVKIIRDYGMEKPADLDFSNPFAIFKLFATSPKTGFRAGHDRIAIIYAVGSIVSGKGGKSLLGGNEVGSTSMVEAIRKADSDPLVKAIVLRVDSPGGSALASDLIWRELKRCKKPVVASMSDVAASGGYYISMAARKIYAQPGTLTGSIGVVGGKIALSGLYKKVGITTETIARGANSGIFSSSDPFTPSERKTLEKLMADTYDQFLSKAIEGRKAAGRKFTHADMVKVAEGRIWTGKQALDKGLIDALGSLDDAVAEAKHLGGLARDADTDYLILPKARSIIDVLLDKAGDAGMSSALSREVLGSAELAEHLGNVETLLQLRGEPVWLMMPHGVRIK